MHGQVRAFILFILFYSGYFYIAPLQVLYYSEELPTITIALEFHAEAPQATASERLAQGPYVAARAGFEPTTLRTKGDESTNEPPGPTHPDRVCRLSSSVFGGRRTT